MDQIDLTEELINHIPAYVDEEIREMLIQCISPDPQDRPTFKSILAVISQTQAKLEDEAR
jgi:hypothetical protein